MTQQTSRNFGMALLSWAAALMINVVFISADAEAIAFRQNGQSGVMDYGFGNRPPKDRAWRRKSTPPGVP